MRTGVIIVNWNGWKDTIECLESLLPRLSSLNAHVVVVDNGSTNESFLRLSEYGQRCADNGACTYAQLSPRDTCTSALPTLILTSSPQGNRGFAAGNNVGIQFLRRQGSWRYFWLLNNDTIVDSDALEHLLQYAAQRPSVGIFGSTILEYYERDRIQCAGGAYYHHWTTTNKSALAKVLVHTLNSLPTPRINYVAGAAMLIRSELVDRVGGLNEQYFLYYEEIDYAIRAKRAGFGLAWCRDSLVYHKGGASTGGGAQRQKSALAEYHSNLSCLKFTKTFYPEHFHKVATTRFVLKSAEFASTRRWRLLRTMARAYIDFFRLGDK